MKKKQWLALVVSRVFEPVVVIPVMLVLAVIYSLNNGLRWRFLVLLLFVDAFLPFLYFLWALRTGRISDWDTTRREERIGLYGVTLLCHLMGVFLAVGLGKVELLRLLVPFYLLAIVFFTITLFYKISVHVGVMSAFVFTVGVLFGWQWWGFFWLVGLVGWSRVVLGKHQLGQVFWGLVLPPLVLWLAFRAWGMPVFCGSC